MVALVDANGNSVASYAYDAFDQLTSASENFGGTTTWTNPYRYDGRDGVRYDGETGLYWMRVYIPTDRFSPLTFRSGGGLPSQYPAQSTHGPIPSQE